MAKSNFLDPVDYDNPGDFPKSLIPSLELQQNEFEWLVNVTTPRLGADDALKFVSAVFWSRYTEDSYYYQCAYHRYKTRLFGAQIPNA